MATQAVSVGASLDFAEQWAHIQWKRCCRIVRRLQTRIVKATREGKWGKVKALQRLLTHSFSGKALAVRRVTENKGKRTAGVDKETWSGPKSKFLAIQTLKQRGYQPKPLRRVYILKSDGKKTRPLGIPCMIDRAMQALYLMALEPISETKADPHSYGFRRSRSTADAISYCHMLLAKRKSPQWVLEGDIKGCFDNIAHDWLIDHVPMDKIILRKWLKAGYMEYRQLYPTEAGTPQGGIISPTLANWALDGLQHHLIKECKRSIRIGGKRIYTSINMVRYADDFVVTGYSKEYLEQKVMPVIEQFLERRGLSLSKEKTRITSIHKGFDFLGQNIRKYNDKFLTKPSKKNICHFLRRIREVVKTSKSMTQLNLIDRLNPIIKGWANYHRHGASKKTFSRMDHEIWKLLWKWCCKRHLKKGKRWVKDKYFHSMGMRHWVFGVKNGKYWPDGPPIWTVLHRADDTPIQRHTKIKSEANPFDPARESYFQKRESIRMMNSLSGRRTIKSLWRNQEGRCARCEEMISKETGWHAHHIRRRVDGGTNQPSNLVLVHPTCHYQIHSQCLSVRKPALARGLWEA